MELRARFPLPNFHAYAIQAAKPTHTALDINLLIFKGYQGFSSKTTSPDEFWAPV
jgi:hypothetical protein